MIFYFDTYTNTFGSHFINLENYLPPEKIDVFERSIIDSSCIHENKIVGLVNIIFIILYCFLLIKYFVIK